MMCTEDGSEFKRRAFMLFLSEMANRVLLALQRWREGKYAPQVPLSEEEVKSIQEMIALVRDALIGIRYQLAVEYSIYSVTDAPAPNEAQKERCNLICEALRQHQNDISLITLTPYSTIPFLEKMKEVLYELRDYGYECAMPKKEIEKAERFLRCLSYFCASQG